MALRYTAPYFQWVNGDGFPLAGGFLAFYESGKSTPLATYTDAALTIPNTNPVEANGDGYWGPIYLQSLDYKVVLTDAQGVQIWTADPVSGNSGASQGTNVRTVTADFAVSPNDGTIICNSATPITGTLPDPSLVIGYTFTIVQVNAGAVTMVGTINGAANYIIPGVFVYTAINLRSDGAGYVIV